MKPKTMIIAGGLATRMKPVTETIPKCLVDIAGKPLIQHQLEFMRDKGYTRFVFCVAHLAQQVQDYLKDGSALGVQIEYSREPETLRGTAGAAKVAEPLIDEDICIVYYGDSLTSMDFDRLIAFHNDSKSDFTIVLRDNPPGYEGTSLITMNEQNEINEFIEKPSPEKREQLRGEKKYINNGIYVMSKKVFGSIPADTKYDFAKQLIPDLLSRKARVLGYVSNDFFREIGRVEKYEKFAEEIREKGRVL